MSIICSLEGSFCARSVAKIQEVSELLFEYEEGELLSIALTALTGFLIFLVSACPMIVYIMCADSFRINSKILLR